ncbi:MAG: FAD binding domain-containing protein [Solirubrobacterales bacterium]
MKPAAFDYEAPASLPEALEMLGRDPEETTVLAGGQSLVPLLNMRLAGPGLVVDVNAVDGLGGIERTAEGGLSLGATVRQRQLETDPRISRPVPLLAEAAGHVAHVAIRTRGTVGGSLCHSDPSAELPACFAALDARARIAHAGGERTVRIRELFIGPLMTVVEPGELLVGLDTDPLPPGTGWGFQEIARTHGAFALVGVAALVRCGPEGRIDFVRLALSGVDKTPWVAEWIEDLALGERPGEALFEHIGERVGQDVEPPVDTHAGTEYRKAAAAALTARTLTTAADRAHNGELAEGLGVADG